MQGFLRLLQIAMQDDYSQKWKKVKEQVKAMSKIEQKIAIIMPMVKELEE